MTSERVEAAQGFPRWYSAIVALVAVTGTLVVSWGSWILSQDTDESATVASATKSWGELWVEVTHVDAVHGVYYALVHVWFQLFGSSTVALRSLSALCIGLAAVGIALIGRRLLTPAVGLIAMVIFFLLPRITYAGVDGRSAAVSTLLVVAATLVLLHALQARSGRAAAWWCAYAALVAATGWVNFFSLIVLAMHALLAWRGRPPWACLLSAGVGAATCLPVILESARQAHQVAWIPPVGERYVTWAFVEQWGDTNGFASGVIWLAAVLGAAALWLSGRRRVAAFLIASALVPMGLMVLASIWVPVYQPRYATSSAPFVALLIAAAVGRLRRRTSVSAVLVAAVIVSAPTWVEQRTILPKSKADWQAVAAYVAAHRQSGSRVAALYGPAPLKPQWSTHRIAVGYPVAFAGMEAVNVGAPLQQSDYLWGTQEEPLPSLSRLGEARQLFVLVSTQKAASWGSGLPAALAGRGWALQSTSVVSGVEISIYRRP